MFTFTIKKMDELTELLKTIDVSKLSNNLSSLFDGALLNQQAKKRGLSFAIGAG
jgi:hypothetical protein